MKRRERIKLKTVSEKGGTSGLTISRDKAFVLGGETLVHVGRVRVKYDGHHVASAGDHGALRLTATQSATQRRTEDSAGRISDEDTPLVDGQAHKHSEGSDEVQSDSVD